MSEPNKSSDQSLNMRKVVGMTITDPSFRNKIAGKSVNEIKEALDSEQGNLGISSSSLTNDSLQALASLTPNELDTLSQIFNKVRNVGVEPPEML